MNSKIQNPKSKIISDPQSDALRILILEDVPTDAELMERELHKGGIAFTSRWVDTRDAFLEQLADFSPDIVLSDYMMPQFNGMEALELVKKRFPSIPLIIVTGSINEETAVNCMKKGAADYVLKEHLTRIGMAVKGALEKHRMIREKEIAQEDLLISIQQWKSTFDAMKDYVFLLDPEGTVLQCNKAMQDLLAKPFQEIIGKTCFKLMHDATEPIKDCPFARMKLTVCRESMVWEKDGRWFDVSIDPVLNGEGDIVGAVHVMADTTDRKLAEDELRKSESKYKTLVEHLPQKIFLKDNASVYVSCNKNLAHDLKIQPDEILGKTDYDFVSKELAEKYRADDKRILESGKTEDIEEKYIQNGRESWVHTTKTVVKDNKGNAIGVIGIFRDITKIKQAEEEKQKLQTQLRQAQKMEALGTLAGGIAHDFNNILMAIIGYAEMTRLNIPNESKANETLEQVIQAGYRAKDLVQQILAFSRQSEEEKKPTKVSFIVKEVLKMLRASLPTTIEIRQEITAPEDTIIADPTQIHQILMNLCTNAHHAMGKKGGVLEVGLRNVDFNSEAVTKFPDLTRGRYLMLTVRDTGQGMDRSTLQRIFDPYFTTKEKDVGTGLGLAVVHGITKSHGGSITVQSELGKGSIFNIFFPVVELDIKTVTEDLEPHPTGNERILFIDDEDVIADLGRRMLQHLGYGVITRTSSIEALEAFRAQPDNFDLVITDQTMPNMTGEDLAKELMIIRPNIPIILCTGFSEGITEEKVKSGGIRALVMKPIALRDIAQTVRRVLDQKIDD